MPVSIRSSGSISNAAQIKDGVITYAKLLGTDIGCGTGHIVILPPFYSAVDAGTWVITNGVGGYLNIFENSTKANNDAVSYKVYLAAGTYTAKVMCNHQADAPILKLKLDGTTILTADTYAAGGAADTITAATGIVVATSGVKTLQAYIDGKNAGSSNYNVRLNAIVLFRTA